MIRTRVKVLLPQEAVDYWPSRNTDPSTCWLPYPILITGAATTVSGSALTTAHPPSAIRILFSGVRPLICGFKGYPHFWSSNHKFGVPSTPLFWQLSRKTHRTQENIILMRRILLELKKKKKKDVNENQTKEEVHRGEVWGSSKQEASSVISKCSQKASLSQNISV